MFDSPGISKVLLTLAAFLFPMSLMAATAGDIEKKMEELFKAADLGDRARYGVVVIDPATGARLVDINGERPMKPASTTKMFTIAALLSHVDPTTRFETTLETDGTIDGDGTLHGHLIIRGGGDPGLGPRFQKDGEVDDVFHKWAAELKRYGIKRIEGDIVGDDSYFADDRWGEGWYPAERGEYYMAEISALSFNDNCIDVTFEGKADVGGIAEVTKIAPKTDYYRIESKIKVVAADASPGNPDFARDDDQKLFTSTGEVAKGATKTRWAAIPDPALYTATVVRDVLRVEGIEVTGDAASRHRAPDANSATPHAAHVLYRHVSAPVADQMVVVLANSQNLYAETMGRHAAIAAGNPSTFRGAVATVHADVERRGIFREGFSLTDGSGLSSLNRIPPRTEAELLLAIEREPFAGPLFKSSMDLAGERGTMARRLVELKGRLRAKTGKLGDTSTLAGYLTIPSGKEYIIAVMIDLVDRGASDTAVEKMVLALDSMLNDWKEGS